MATPLLDLVLGDTTVTHTDGTHPIEFAGASVSRGPGDIAGETYEKAIQLDGRAAGAVDISDLAIDRGRFHVRVVFQVPASFSGRQNLVESDRLPFALYLQGGRGRNGIDLVASVKPAAHGWRAADTEFGAKVKVGEWHVGDLVYDGDTVAVYLDEQIVSVHAFPQGRIDLARGKKLYVGSWVDGRRNHFDGKLAAVTLDAGVPPALKDQLDERRSSAEWYITHKAEQLRPTLDLGDAAEAPEFQAAVGAWIQRWDRGAFMYHPAAGQAFEMHGAIYQRFRAMRTKASLGYLVSDEVPATDARGRKSLFSKGGIYWSSATGAHEVVGQLYLSYENLGESRALGFPKRGARRISGGHELTLERARLYHRDGASSAHEVHGEILRRFLATGGIAKWGFPVTDEMPLRRDSTEIGRMSEFERCTFLWSGATGAHEVHGDIRRKYEELGGPAGELGLPTSDERAIPGVTGPGQTNAFQKGSICWYGSYASMVVARPFKLFLGSLNTDESEGWGMGQNDLYVKVTIKHGSNTVYSKKHPKSGDWSGRNVRDVNITFPPVLTPDKPVTFSVDVWESDSGAPFGGGDDHIGKWTKRLDAANGWGLRENQGILDSGSFRKVNNIRASVKPQVDVSSLSETDKFWGVKNRGTDDISWGLYANAFRDVDSDTEWWDVTDWLDKAFYELVAKDIAESGNCFGMCLEAVYARKGASPFSLPLDRFTNWNTLRPNFNVKHQYQVGASAIWWFLGQFITGNTHDPVDVFRRTRAAFARGEDPVLCLAQNYDFSGRPHVVLPVGWNDGSKPWRMDILDPNFPGKLKQLTVDPDRNTFVYQGSARYSGGEWSGGRMHYMPFSILDSAPRTPVWDAILLLLAGTVIILGADGETDSITDPDGNDLDAYGARATAQLKAGGHLSGYFASYRGFDGAGVLPGELLIARGPVAPDVVDGPAIVDPGTVVNAPIAHLGANRELRRLRDGILSADRRHADRPLAAIAADDAIMGNLGRNVRDAIGAALGAGRPGDFVHTVKGKRRGKLRHLVKHGLSEFQVGTSTSTGHTVRVRGKDLGTRNAEVSVRPDRDTRFDVTVTQKLGVGGDKATVGLVGIPGVRGEELRVQPGPGLGTVDVAAPRGRATVRVEVESTRGKRTSRRAFRVQVDGAARLTLSPADHDRTILASRLTGLRGSVLDTVVVDADD